ncbi:MAG TPA: cupin domain-containing protein [Polyangia bacterium]|nr:cupin domain-containing protein [Polyangia bacterium]
MMRLHIIVAALLLGHCAFAQKKAAVPASGGKQVTVKLKVPPVPPSTDEYLVAQLADAHWMSAQKLDAKIPAGADVALIGADPMSTGVTMYLRTKPGYKLPLHWHIHHETDTMLSGKGTFVVDGKKIPAMVGTFVVVPSRAKHEFSCDSGADCVLIVRRSGPTDYNWVAK